MNYHNLTDCELVLQYQNGDHASFEELISRHKKKIYTYILITVKNSDLAEDIFQDTFIKVIKSLKEGKYTHQGRFVSWVARIAHNLIIDHFRKTTNFKTFNHEERELDLYSNKIAADQNIEDRIINDQVSKDIRKIISLLPEEQREIIVLRHYVGLSFKEIAEETNVSINTALGRMRYALINLRKLIEENKMQLAYV